ncbi:MAG: TetR/AcrR family transcriptional regulator [Roseibium sp.]|uniref:TetR/AcrR family transcriptional regulator n=1 Tax=Roseibium sp. TaxID=1936156 RepID=UPI00262B6D89|nr:TetR/AcrR family transcriptional regulator [Roseibium sp.]MCV0427854.1 TetR/AcrR family transcriptional regulator [Roseibium sp.]
MEPESTSKRLLKTAERLMAEKGISATSVREITDAAEANVASVNYYFGGKSELLLQLLKNRFLQLDVELLARVTAVEENAAGGTPEIRDLTGAYFDALAYLGFNHETGELDTFILLIQRASAEQEAVLDRAQDYNAPGITKLINLLAISVPPERQDQLDIPTLMGLMFTASVTAMVAMKTEKKNDVLFSAIRDFLVAGVEAYMRRFAD